MGIFLQLLCIWQESPFVFNNVRMNVIVKKIGQTLFPETFRPYVTFRMMTFFVVVLTLWNIGFSVLMKEQMSRLRAHYPGQQQLHSPYFMILYNIGALIGFSIIYATRGKPQYYQLRVICYGMLLGGVVGEVLGRLL